MEIFLIICLIAVLVARWVHLKNRLESLESRLTILANLLEGQDLELKKLRALTSSQQEKAAPAAPSKASVADLPKTEPFIARPAPPSVEQSEPAPAEMPREYRVPQFVATTQAPPSTDEWETRLGGNWLNKLGVFILVVGIALALGYSFTRVGPLGRVVTSAAISLAMLVCGTVWERRDRYRMFARGLMGGGWAALYVTAYAMHAVEAARVIPNAVAGFFLLLAVAVGMIVHSLRYRSQTVTAVAYFVAFGTLAIAEASSLPLIALIPLAISLLVVAHRFSWMRLALLGLVASYGVSVLRGQAGVPLWQAQSIFGVYWLLFEVFDILHPGSWLLPLNAVGFLGLSLVQWNAASPATLWVLFAATAAAYLISAMARVRSGEWQGAATLTAALTAAAVFQKLDHQWIASALVVEAELFYLAGLRLRAPYLRWLGSSLFGVELGRLLVNDVTTLPSTAWVPVASLDAVVFYANRALVPLDTFYGFAAAGALALVIGQEVPDQYRSIGWLALAGASFALGWWRRLFDFRIQGYVLGVLGTVAALIAVHKPPLAVAAAVSYAALLCALRTASDRWIDQEGALLRVAASVTASFALGTLAWRLVSGEYLGLAWMALALLLLELGLRGLPEDFRGLAYAVAALGAGRMLLFNLPEIQNVGPWIPRLIPAGAALLAYAIAARARTQMGGLVFAIASLMGTVFLLDASWALLPAAAVAPVWAAGALALLVAGRKSGQLLWQSYAAAALAFVRCWYQNFDGLSVTPPGAVWTGSLVAASFYSAMLLRNRGSRGRLYYSLLGTTLTVVLLDYNISGSMLTVAWGIQGVALLGAGFPLSDRVLRLSGLMLLLVCIGKLFVWDLRHLETLPRIFSFIVLGLLLLGVSWVYTRYRERVSRYL
ncbi:MAG TPA: DUF2339 domain-containing protein [Bryobacteraceae bacterium]|nr:DUF2339 domain-containing protein [Bryobacteraceae bacterium]